MSRKKKDYLASREDFSSKSSFVNKEQSTSKKTDKAQRAIFFWILEMKVISGVTGLSYL